MPDKNIIRFSLNNITKKYKSHSVGPINFKIYENEVIALIGKTGCGKTTIAKIIMGLTKYNSGTLLYKQELIDSISLKEFRSQNQMMFQNSLLSVNPLLKIGKIVKEPLLIQKNHKNISERVDELLNIFELSKNILNKYPDEVSGGELQRLVFLRTIILKPEFIILDEPFANLNRDMAIRLIESIKKIRKKSKLGILIITHSLDYAELFADRFLEFPKLLQSEYL